MKSPFSRSCGYMLALLLLAAGGLMPAAGQDLAHPALRVTPGDAIHLYIYENLFPMDKGKFIGNYHDKEFIVDGLGQIQLGPLGHVQIAGLKPEEIAQVLQEKFKPFAKDPYIIVIPLIRLELKGGFAQPGLYRFNPNMSFWEMMKEVGGLHSLSAFEDMHVLRNGQPIYHDFGEAFYRGQSLYELGFESGDEVIAPRVNRLSFDTIMRYIQFGMSMLVFYLTLVNYNTNKT
jgi:protein involved in polysaccharide export with SLBB domain